jgi:DNA invertase Pin-like site-specific DNA recombinase
VHAKGIDLYLHQQAIDTTTPAGKALFQMMGVFAEFERAMIRERVNAGLARARAFGKRLGRPRVGDAIEAEIARVRQGSAQGRKGARARDVNGSAGEGGDG